MSDAPIVSAYFDQIAPNWDEVTDKPGAKHVAVAALAGVGPGKRVLDLGCGTGIMAQAYAACEAGEVVALDISPEMIRRAKANHAKLERVSFLCCDALSYEDDEPFDVAVVYNAYPHFLDKPALVRKVASLLAPNGRFLVAHGVGREMINHHHRMVPPSVTSELLPAAEHAQEWEDLFSIDLLIDAEHLYAFGGALRPA